MKDGVIIRAPSTSDRPAALSVVRDAFRREAEAALIEKLWAEDAIDIELIAEQESVIIGYCAFSAVTAAPTLDGKLLGLAPLAVLNEYQGRGVGKALAMQGLEACRANNAALVVVLGEPDYYSRFGFKCASDFQINWAVMDAGAAFQLIDFNGVTDGEPHMIHYHPAFSEV